MLEVLTTFALFLLIAAGCGVVIMAIRDITGYDEEPEPKWIPNPIVQLRHDLEELKSSCYLCCPDECRCFNPPEELPMAEECVMSPCGQPFDEHLEAVPLTEVHEVGRVYETIATREGVLCHPDGGVFWNAWIRSYTSDKCCGIDELVAFHKKPPKQFVYAKNGEILEVYGNGLRNAG